MKKALVFFVLIVVAAISGCSNNTDLSAGNPFTAEDAIKGQTGDLYYVVPGNATLDDESPDGLLTFHIPIENTTEEHMLNIMYSRPDNQESYEAFIQYYQSVKETAEAVSNEVEGVTAESQMLTEFLGRPTDYGFVMTQEAEGKKGVSVYAATSNKLYAISYVAKTAFYDQTFWDNFYAQLKFV